MHSNVAASITAHCSLFLILPIFHLVESVHLITCVAFHLPHAVPRPLTLSAYWSCPPLSAQIKSPNLSPLAPLCDTFAINLFLPCFPLPVPLLPLDP